MGGQHKHNRYSNNWSKVVGSANPEDLINDYLQEGANVNAGVDGTTPKNYDYTVPAGKSASFTRMMITIEDGTGAFSSGDFGAIAGALTNGVSFQVAQDGSNFTEVANWKTNRQIRDTFYDFDQSMSAVDGAYTGRWTFTKDMGATLHVPAGGKVRIVIQDNLAALTYLSFRIKGLLQD